MDSMNGSVDSMDRGVDSMDSVDGGMDSVDGGVDSVDRGMHSRVSRGRSVVGNAFIGHFSNIATVGIGSVVVDHLGSAIRENNSVGSRSGVAISLLLLTELGSTVVIGNAILASIDSRAIIRWLRSVARVSGHAEGGSQQGGHNSDSLHVDDSKKFFQLIPC